MSTQIEILLKARDEATKQIQTAFKNAEQSLTQFNTVAGQTGKTLQKAGKDVSGFNQYMKEGRTENRQFGFVMREVMDIVGGAALMIKLFGGNSSDSEKQAKRLSEVVMMGYIAFQATETIVSLVKIGMNALRTATVVTTVATETLTVAQMRLDLAMKATKWGLIISAVAAAGVGLYSYIAAAEKALFVTGSLAEKQVQLEKEQKFLTTQLKIGSSEYNAQKIVVNNLEKEIAELTEKIKEKTYIVGSSAAMDEQLKEAQILLNEKLVIGSAEYYIQAQVVATLTTQIANLKKGIIELEGIEIPAMSMEAMKKELDAYAETLKSKEQRTEEYFDNLMKLEELYSGDKDKIAKLQTEKDKALYQIKLDQIAQGLQLANQAVGLVGQFFQQEAEKDIQVIEEKRDLQIKAIDDQLAAEGISAEKKAELEAQKKALEEEAAAKIKEEKTKAFENQKTASAIESIINTAVAVTKVIANPIQAAVVAALGLAQTALIYSQPTPKFHQGGTAFINASSGTEVPIMVRGQETVRVTTPEQEGRRGGGSITINFNSPVSDTQFVTNSIKKVIRETGIPIEELFVNTRSEVVL